MCGITKTIPIHFIDGKCHKCHIKQGKVVNLFNQITHSPYHIISVHWLLMPSGAGHTDRQADRHTHTATKAISRNHASTCGPVSCAHLI